MFRSVVVLLLCAFAVGCASAPTDETPSGALRLFLEAMADSTEDPAARARAYALLAPEARSRLARRAREVGAVSGRSFFPYEMLAERRYRLRFRPRPTGGFVERVDGDRAIVVVRGTGPNERADVPMVREGEHWRVFISVPDVASPARAAASRRTR